MPNQNAEKEFLDKLEQVVKENLANEHFGVSELAKEMGMSRSNLHRKVNSITKTSVSQYIRNTRLKSAKELLRKTSDTVSEVGYKVGFSSTSYFIKCFGDFYGYPPGQVGDREDDESSPVPKQERKKKWFTALVSVLSVLILAAVIVTLVVTNVIDGSKFVKSAKAREIKSLVVLPFVNLTGDSALDDRIDGLHAMLITDMQQLSSLRIICHTSSNAYRNTDLKIAEITTELNVDAALESQLVSLGDSIIMQFSLINPHPEEQQVWSKKFQEEKGKIFYLFNQFKRNIADEIKLELTRKEELAMAESKTVHPDALDAYLKGMKYWDRLGKEDLLKAKEYFNIAHEKDPDWADPYVGLAMVWGGLSQMGYEPASIANPKIKEYTQKALEIDPNSALCHFKQATGAVWQEWNWEKGEKEFKKAIELNPSNAKFRIYYAHLLTIINRKEDALLQAELALELSPMDPLILGLYGTVTRMYSQYDKAQLQLTKALSIDPDHYFTLGSLSTSYRHTKQYDLWFDLWKKRSPLDSETIAVLEETFTEKGYHATVEKMIEIDEKIYNDGGRITEKRIGDKYAQIKQFEKALDYWEIAYEKHDPNLPYLSVYSRKNKELGNNPRYIELIKKLKLPLQSPD